MQHAHINATIEEIVSQFGITDTLRRAGRALPAEGDLTWGCPVLSVVSPLVGEHGTDRLLTSFYWGFNPVVPSLGSAKLETASRKPTWSLSYSRRRCLMPVTRFGSLSSSDGSLLAIGAVYDATGSGLAVMTGPADPLHQHEKMPHGYFRKEEREPLVVPEQFWGRWLDPTERDPDSFADELLLASAAWNLHVKAQHDELTG